MKENQEYFLAKSTVRAADMDHRRKINFNISKYNASVPFGKTQFEDVNLVRERAKNIKWRAIESLDQRLEEFESAFTKHGGKVIWAEDSGQALDAIMQICREKKCRTVVKSKSMVTEEIKLNEFLHANNIESIETDLGEYIQQLDGEPPYHIVTPAMHKSKEDVAKLFYEKLQTAPNLNPSQITSVAREKLRKKYVEAEVGITGANFILADTGAIAVSENEGNARLSASFPRTHIAIVGIEKVLSSINDLALFWPLLSTFGTGQKLTVYNSIITGPKKSGETDGPEEMYVILLDNGRTNILANPETRESLYCIRCGACLNACPVYKNVGGHTYGTPYSGPIGAVITPHLRKMEDWKHLSYASSLCGNCTEVCAVKINLHQLLLVNRSEAVESGYTTWTERTAWRVWRQASLSRRLMNQGSSAIKNMIIIKLFKTWGAHHGKLQFSPKTFNEMWAERNKEA